MNKILSLKNISKKYSGKSILKDISLEIYEKEIVAFIALNGQGKTTTLKIISGITMPDSGQISLKRQDLVFLPELPYFFDEFNVVECIDYLLRLEGNREFYERLNERLDFYGIHDRNKKISDFSKGMRQKVGIILCELSDRNVILMDEPYSGLDISAQKKLKKSILEMREKGKTVFFTSHNLELVWDVCDRFIILHNGEIRQTGNPKDFGDFEDFRSNFEHEALIDD